MGVGNSGGSNFWWNRQWLLPDQSRKLESALYPGIGVVLGFIVVYILIFVWNLFGAPYRQRDEAIKAAEQDVARISKEKEILKQELDNIKNARPNIVVLGVKNITTPIRNLRTGEILGEPCFTQVLFTNNPILTLQAVDATNVAAHIDIYHQDKTHLFYIIGRWAETKEEARGAQPFEMEQIMMPPNGRANPLDICLKYKDDADGYGHNNESRRASPTDWRDKQRAISMGNYLLRVRLRGNNVDSTFWFDLTNGGKGQEITLAVAANVPSILDKEGSQT